jgi:hypothetical protein
MSIVRSIWPYVPGCAPCQTVAPSVSAGSITCSMTVLAGAVCESFSNSAGGEMGVLEMPRGELE